MKILQIWVIGLLIWRIRVGFLAQYQRCPKKGMLMKLNYFWHCTKRHNFCWVPTLNWPCDTFQPHIWWVECYMLEMTWSRKFSASHPWILWIMWLGVQKPTRKCMVSSGPPREFGTVSCSICWGHGWWYPGPAGWTQTYLQCLTP